MYVMMMRMIMFFSYVLSVQMCARTPADTSVMAGYYRQDEHGFYYPESTNYNPAGYEFSAPGNQFPVDP